MVHGKLLRIEKLQKRGILNPYRCVLWMFCVTKSVKPKYICSLNPHTLCRFGIMFLNKLFTRLTNGEIKFHIHHIGDVPCGIWCHNWMCTYFMCELPKLDFLTFQWNIFPWNSIEPRVSLWLGPRICTYAIPSTGVGKSWKYAKLSCYSIYLCDWRGCCASRKKTYGKYILFYSLYILL
jgi:hypothetical protein